MANVHSVTQKIHKQRQIMHSAIILFEHHDYSSISISQIAKQAGVAKGTIFSYFKTREDLFMMILLKGYQNYFDYLIQRIQRNRPLTSRTYVDFMVKSTRDLIKNHPVLLRLNALRGPILESRANMEETVKQRNRLYKEQEVLGRTIQSKVGSILTANQFGHLFLIQSGIISGIMNMNALSQFNHHNLSVNYKDFNINIVKEAVRQMKYYLDGYIKEFGNHEATKH